MFTKCLRVFGDTDLSVSESGHICTQVQMTRRVHKHHLKGAVEVGQRGLKTRQKAKRTDIELQYKGRTGIEMVIYSRLWRLRFAPTLFRS